MSAYRTIGPMVLWTDLRSGERFRIRGPLVLLWFSVYLFIRQNVLQGVA